MTAHIDPRTPVLIGVGVCDDSAEAVDLMARAVERAAIDTGNKGLLASIDRIAVPQGTWTYADPARLVANAVGATQATTHLVELGIPQQSPINEALLAIMAGTSRIAAVVGGESKRWARKAGSVETGQTGVVPDVLHQRRGPIVEPVEVATRLWDPVQQYAMIENARRVANDLTFEEHRNEVSDLWSRFNRVAQQNPKAAFPAPMSAAEIMQPSSNNRPLAFPYNKWHSTQWTVDQAAALIFCSVEEATRLRVPSDQWVFPLVGLESSHAVSMLARQDPQRWPAMQILGNEASARIGRPIAEIEALDLYSCFPAAVAIQQRELGLVSTGTPTITGGMAFAGGPFNNFVLQATVAMAQAIRTDPTSEGLVTTVSGLLTKPGIGIWSAQPDPRGPLIADMGTSAAAVTKVVDVVETLEEYSGPATVVTYTVTYDGMAPSRTAVLCDIADGRRCVAFSEDEELATFATETELIGTKVTIERGKFRST